MVAGMRTHTKYLIVGAALGFVALFAMLTFVIVAVTLLYYVANDPIPWRGALRHEVLAMWLSLLALPFGASMGDDWYDLKYPHWGPPPASDPKGKEER